MNTKEYEQKGVDSSRILECMETKDAERRDRIAREEYQISSSSTVNVTAPSELGEKL